MVEPTTERVRDVGPIAGCVCDLQIHAAVVRKEGTLTGIGIEVVAEGLFFCVRLGLIPRVKLIGSLQGDPAKTAIYKLESIPSIYLRKRLRTTPYH